MSGKRAKMLRGHGKEGWISTSTANLMEEAAIYVVALRKWYKKVFRRNSFNMPLVNPYTCANRYVKREYTQHRAATGISL